MANRLKPLLPSAAIAFGFLFFAGPASNANAQVAFQAQLATPFGGVGIAAGPGPYYAGHHRNYRYGHPYRGHFYRHGRRPYWLRRAYVYAPFPRWIVQRVYYPYPYAYSPPYGYYVGGY